MALLVVLDLDGIVVVRKVHLRHHLLGLRVAKGLIVAVQVSSGLVGIPLGRSLVPGEDPVSLAVEVDALALLPVDLLVAGVHLLVHMLGLERLAAAGELVLELSCVRALDARELLLLG